jgi:hypothetical protein
MMRYATKLTSQSILQYKSRCISSQFKNGKMWVHEANTYMFMVSYIFAFVAFATSTIWNPAILSP